MGTSDGFPGENGDMMERPANQLQDMVALAAYGIYQFIDFFLNLPLFSENIAFFYIKFHFLKES